MPASHSGLRRMYRRLNKLYFNSELPDIEVVWEPNKLESVAVAHYDSEGKVNRLTFDPAMKGYNKAVKLDMCHEMIHVKCPTIKHGKKFDEEVQRLCSFPSYRKLL